MTLIDKFVSEDEVVSVPSDMPDELLLDRGDLGLPDDREITRVRLEGKGTDNELEFDVVHDRNDDGNFHSGYRALYVTDDEKLFDLLPLLPEPMIQNLFQAIDNHLQDEIIKED